MTIDTLPFFNNGLFFIVLYIKNKFILLLGEILPGVRQGMMF